MVHLSISKKMKPVKQLENYVAIADVAETHWVNVNCLDGPLSIRSKS